MEGGRRTEGGRQRTEDGGRRGFVPDFLSSTFSLPRSVIFVCSVIQLSPEAERATSAPWPTVPDFLSSRWTDSAAGAAAPEACLTVLPNPLASPPMSVLEIKQSLSRMSAREQKEVSLYLLRLRRESSAWKKTTARRIREMKAGGGTSIEELEKRYAGGK